MSPQCHDITIAYLRAQDLSEKTPKEVAQMYHNAYIEIYETLHPKAGEPNKTNVNVKLID